jgi:hypothetical protein
VFARRAFQRLCERWWPSLRGGFSFLMLESQEDSFFGVFLLPGGRPRRFGASCFDDVIQAGGLPRRLWPELAAKRCRLIMAASI